jgi:HEAT repeat protein
MDPLDTLLNELQENLVMPSQASLYHLSDLDDRELVRVRRAWRHLPKELRQEMIARLVELAEADFEVNFGALFRLGLEDEDPTVRTASVEGLWEDEDVCLIPILATRLLEDENIDVRTAAAISLGRFILMGELKKIRPESSTTAYEALLAACQDVDEHIEVRRRALESLAYLGNETVAALIREAYEAHNVQVRVSAVFAMGRTADTGWANQVRQELFRPDPELRYEAARACGELQLQDAVPELEELADDADPEVQEAALWALGQIGGDRARKILERYCLAEDEAIQTAAEAALDELEFLHGDLSDVFVRLVGDEDVAWSSDSSEL